jgi:ferritin-like metal-binding protein YciE
MRNQRDSQVDNRQPARSKNMDSSKLRDLYEDDLRDIYWAEKYLLKTLQEMAEASDASDLQEAFRNHQNETQNQVTRLEQVFQVSGLGVDEKKCEGMKGLTEEGKEKIKDFEKGPTRDAALIISAQKVEHYEIAAYGSLRALAETLGYTEAADLLEQSLEEESAADEALSGLASSINKDALAETDNGSRKEEEGY